jgi:phosphatidylglycerophosphate synthase
MSKYKKGEALPLEEGLYMYIAPTLGPILYETFGLTPNMITSLGNLIGAFSINFIIKKQYVTGAFLAIIRQILDGVDGYVARRYNLASKFGNSYDHISDRIFGTTITLILLSHIYKKYDFKITLLATLPLLTFKFFNLKRLWCLENKNECKDERIKHMVLSSTRLLSNLDMFVFFAVIYTFLLKK